MNFTKIGFMGYTLGVAVVTVLVEHTVKEVKKYRIRRRRAKSRGRKVLYLKDQVKMLADSKRIEA